MLARQRLGSIVRCAYHELSFQSRGEPQDVLEYHHHQVDDAALHQQDRRPNHVGVEMLCAPLNPADINTIQGKYPDPADTTTRQSLLNPNSIVAGSEGIGIVRYVPSSQSTIRKGTVVTVGLPGAGTMRSFLWAPPTSLVPLARGDELIQRVGAAAASTLPQLGGTAWRMLQDYSTNHHHHGAVIQNAGNSSVGFMVSQLAHTIMDRKVISVVRRGSKTSDEWDKLVQHLETEGKCDVVVAEEDLTTKEDIQALSLRTSTTTSKPIMLALNAVGGPSASLLSKLLAPGGSMVTYGGMSKQPVTVSTPHFIFKDLSYYGYWHSRWMSEARYEQKKEMMDLLVDFVLDRGVSCPPTKVFSLDDKFADALKFDNNATKQQQGIRRKIVFQCQQQGNA